MADQRTFEEREMDAFFHGEISLDADRHDHKDNADAAVPVKHGLKNRKPSGKRNRRAIAARRVLAALCGVVAIGLVIGITVYVSSRRNNGAKHAEKLSLSLGASVMDAQQNAKINLVSESKYSILNPMLQPIGGVLESKKTIEVQGIHLPQWLILCDVTEGLLTEVTYFNYTVLKEQSYGTERKSYLEPSAAALGSTVEQTESLLGLSPYAVSYHGDRTETREYRYCYEDAETENLTAYIITAKWNAEGGLTEISDVRVDILSGILGNSAL